MNAEQAAAEYRNAHTTELDQLRAEVAQLQMTVEEVEALHAYLDGLGVPRAVGNAIARVEALRQRLATGDAHA